MIRQRKEGNPHVKARRPLPAYGNTTGPRHGGRTWEGLGNREKVTHGTEVWWEEATVGEALDASDARREDVDVRHGLGYNV